MQNPPAATMPTEAHALPTGAPTVQHFRQALLWPLRLMPAPHAGHHHAPWHVLREMGDASPWREEVDEYTGDSSRFHERHYNEFVSFLPYVQRFLYGEGRSRGNGESKGNDGDSPMRIFRRHDVAAVRLVSQPGDAPVTLDVIHCDLYFFFDIDVVLLNLEVGASNLSLAQAQDILYRFGRAYPSGWEADGSALHCMASVEWLGADGRVLASSDAQQREAGTREQHVGVLPGSAGGRGHLDRGRIRQTEPGNEHAHECHRCDQHHETHDARLPCEHQVEDRADQGHEGHRHGQVVQGRRSQCRDCILRTVEN